MRAADAGTVEPVLSAEVRKCLSAEVRKCGEHTVHGDHQQAIFGDAVVWVTPNGPVHEAEQPQVRPSPCASLDAAHAIGSDLPGA